MKTQQQNITKKELYKVSVEDVKRFFREIDAIYKKKDFNFYDYDVVSKKFTDFGINRFSRHYFVNVNNYNYILDFDFVKKNNYSLEEVSQMINVSYEDVYKQFTEIQTQC